MSERVIETVVPKRHAEILIHMLGAGEHVPKRSHGYRNQFCACIGEADYKLLNELLIAGLVTAGPVINEGRDQYFFATLEGCKAIGLGKAATRRALGI